MISNSFSLKSDVFSNGHEIPKKFTGEGKDDSPPLHWTLPPPGTKSYALICEDPDAPTPEPFIHWVIYGLPASASTLPEGIPSKASFDKPIHGMQGVNSFGKIGYGGPMPPVGHGKHHYHFKLYALDQEIPLPPGVDQKTLLKAIQGHVLQQAELTGIYQR